LTRTVDNHVARLRQKIEKNAGEPEHLITVHRVGYKFLG
jgi:DNA-binding response OmpR family regulator